MEKALNNVRKNLFFLLVLLLINIFHSQKIFAATVKNPGANFVVTPNRDLTPNANPSHQNNLWILVNGGSQQIGLNIENKDDTDKNFIIVANTAYTGIDGQIHYDLIRPPVDRSLKYDFRAMFDDSEQKVTVAAKTKKSFTLNLKIPKDKNYQGQVLGAITVYQSIDQETLKKDKGTKIVNQFAIGFPVALNFGDQETEINSFEDPFALGKVEPGFNLRGGLAILAELRNTQPAQALNLNIDAKVTEVDKSTVLYRSRSQDIQMAPNSFYRYQINWTAKKGLRPGKYRLVMIIKVPGDLQKKYRLVKDFTITSSQARKFNEQVNIKPNYLWLYIIIGIFVLLLLLLFTFWFSRHQKIKQENSTRLYTDK